MFLGRALNCCALAAVAARALGRRELTFFRAYFWVGTFSVSQPSVSQPSASEIGRRQKNVRRGPIRGRSGRFVDGQNQPDDLDASAKTFRNSDKRGSLKSRFYVRKYAFSKIAEVRRFSGSSETMLLYVFTKENTNFGPSNLKCFSAEPLIVARSRLSPLAR